MPESLEMNESKMNKRLSALLAVMFGAVCLIPACASPAVTQQPATPIQTPSAAQSASPLPAGATDAAPSSQQAARQTPARGYDKKLDAPLLAAVSAGDARNVKSLLERGANPNAARPIGDGTHSHTALMLAADNGKSLDTVKALLEAGADVNASSDTKSRREPGTTALMLAVRPDIKLATTGATPLELVRVLVDGGADVNAADETGTSVLMSAGNADTIAYLIERGADAKAKDTEGNTVLMRLLDTFKVGDDVALNSVRLLIENGADFNEANEEGETPLARATRLERKKIIALLKDKGARE